MVWKIKFTISAEKEFGKLDRIIQKRIVTYLKSKVSVDPRQWGSPLKGSSQLVKLWRYRVGDHRMICQIKDESITVLVVKVAKRDSVYKSL